jgi:hypothetical protein
MTDSNEAPSTGVKIFRLYRVRSPLGEVFGAAIVYTADQGLHVMANRGGDWHIDPSVRAADLALPEQDWNEWDVERLPVPDGAT